MTEELAQLLAKRTKFASELIPTYRPDDGSDDVLGLQFATYERACDAIDTTEEALQADGRGMSNELLREVRQLNSDIHIWRVVLY